MDDESDPLREDKKDKRNTITAEEEAMDDLYRSIVEQNNSENAKESSIIQSITYHEEDPFTIHKTYQSVFDRRLLSVSLLNGSPTRAPLLSPSSSTPISLPPDRPGTPKRERSESPEIEVKGVKTLRTESPKDKDVEVNDTLTTDDEADGATATTERTGAREKADSTKDYTDEMPIKPEVEILSKETTISDGDDNTSANDEV